MIPYGKPKKMQKLGTNQERVLAVLKDRLPLRLEDVAGAAGYSNYHLKEIRGVLLSLERRGLVRPTDGGWIKIAEVFR